VRLSTDASELAKWIDRPHAWDCTGTVGVFAVQDSVLLATLSTTGMQLVAIELGTLSVRR
jgi:hypothetical protein